MSRLPSLPIVEWSPQGVRVLEPSTGKVHEGGDVEQALTLAGRPRQVVLALARRQTFLRTMRLPDVAQSEAKNILALQLEDAFPVDTADLSYDLEFTQDRNQDGRLAVVVAAKADVLRQAKAAIRATGAKVVRTVPAFLGATQLAAETATPSCLVIDRSPEGMTFDVVDDGHVLYSRTATGMPVGEALEAEIVRTLASAKLPSAPVISPLELDSAHVRSTTQTTTLTALANTSSHIDLILPEEVAKAAEGAVRSRRLFAALAAAGALAAIGGFLWDQDDAAQALAREKSKWDRDVRAVESDKNIITGQLNKVEDRGEVVLSAFEPKQYSSDVYAAISNAVTPGIWLTGVSYERGKPVTIRGTAKTNEQVATYVDALSALSRFREVTLTFSNDAEIEEVPVVQFSITAHVVGNFPLLEPPQERGRGR